MRNMIPLLIFSALVWAIFAGAQNVGMNCADECQNKLANCRASCKALVFHKRSYNKCMDGCDDEWRECRKKCR